MSTNNNNKPSQQSYNLPELQYDKNNNVDGNIAFLNDSKTMEPTKSRPFTKVVRRQLPAVPPPPTILTKWPLIVGTKDFESKSFEYARQAPSRQVGQMLQKGVRTEIRPLILKVFRINSKTIAHFPKFQTQTFYI